MLSHSQAALERGFNVKKEVLNVNMCKISITSRKLTTDYINSHILLPVTPDHKESVKISEMFSTEIPRVLKRERILTETKHTVPSVSHNLHVN